MRNVLVHVSHREKNVFADKLKTIFKMPSRIEALRYADYVIEIYWKRFPKAIGVLGNALKNALTYFYFPLLPETNIFYKWT